MQGYHHQPHYAQHTSARGQLQAGVTSFMNGVYAWMTAGIALTALVAWGLSRDLNMMMMVFGGPQKYLFLLGPFFLAMFLQVRIARMDSGVATALFLVFSALSGVTLSYVPLIFTSASILGILLATTGTFAGMAAVGYLTKKDLSNTAGFLGMALWGAIIAGVINMFLGSTGLSIIISAVVAATAVGLTAYYTQLLKQQYLMHGGGGNLAILGALILYINFYNLFVSLLRLFGSSRD